MCFVAKSGLNSQELRQLLSCVSFQPEHYSSLSFHVVFVSRLNGDYTLTLMIFYKLLSASIRAEHRPWNANSEI